jgi:hypothetical protein
VYDTRKDSDGGAWRKRTQGTSWYNETLNTATRGSRKEFPAVAVIVAESNQVTIYDGDDPDLPMWMVFNAPSTTPYSIVANISANLTSVTALNGVVCFGNGANYGLGYINFVSEVAFPNWRENAHSIYLGNIAERNDQKGVSTYDTNYIVDERVNDVAMTVLPNAPIDAATGLPVPTIAVATDGGVSVIKDDGTVVDFTNSTAGGPISIGEDGIVYVGRTTLSTCVIYGFNMPSADISAQDYYYADSQVPKIGDAVSGGVIQDVVRTGDASLSYAYNNHFGNISEVREELTRGMISKVTSTYNTGWMNGDIKLATLSDTDATNVTGSELVTNGTFDSDTTGWTAVSGTTLSVDTNRLKVLQTTGSSAFGYQVVTTVVGETYVLTADFTQGSNVGAIRISGSSYSGTDLGWTGYISTSAVYKTFVATSTTTYISVQSYGGTGGYVFADNISVRLAEEDRSVNGNGLQVFGTVTKSAVATGADLVGYSGFSNNNYLQQPVNADLQFGTGDFCAMGWFKTTNSTTEPFYFYGQYTTGWVGGGQHRVRLTSGYMNFAITDDNWGSSDQITSGATYNNNIWHHYCGVRRANQIELYANGVLVASTAITAATGSISNTGATLNYGRRQDGNSGAVTTGSLALSRISATAPSPEQIKKIYEDEKVLFQENAQATLYGSSDAVTALAYDDTTELLHVGTSAGRSVFQGLRRVDNTTTAVGAAISASNGLVADE